VKKRKKRQKKKNGIAWEEKGRHLEALLDRKATYLVIL